MWRKDVRLKKKFPRVLLAVSKADVRRKAFLELTRAQFVVDECVRASDFLGMWTHPLFYDFVIFQLDVDLDPASPFVIPDIRRMEAEPQYQEKSDLLIRRKIRTGETEPFPLSSHRAQRFAENQRIKQEIINAQQKNQAAAAPPNALIHRTIVFGFFALPSEREAMEISKQYDYILQGTPDQHIETYARLFRTDYQLSQYELSPTFDEVVRNMKEVGEQRRALLEDSGSVVNNASGSLALVQKWKDVLSEAKNRASSGAAVTTSTAGVLNLERHLRDATAHLEEMTAARDAAESDLQATNRECHILREEVESLKEEVAAAVAARESAEILLDSRVFEMNEFKKEVEIQLRAARTTSAVGGTTSGAAASANADIQHLVAQNNRLRDAAFEYQTQLHTMTQKCQGLQRKLDRIVRGAVDRLGSSRRGSLPNNGPAKRRSSLVRMALPSADDLFKTHRKSRSDSVVAADGPLGDSDEAKFGEELESGSSDDSDGSPETSVRNAPLVATNSFKGFQESAQLTKKHSSFLKRAARSTDKLFVTRHCLERTESNLMAFHDGESRIRNYFESAVSWMKSTGAAGKIDINRQGNAALLFQKETSVTKQKDHLPLLEAWAAVEADSVAITATSALGDLAVPAELLAASLCNSKSQGDVGIVRQLMIEEDHSSIGAENVHELIRKVFPPLFSFLANSLVAYRRIIVDMMISELQHYENIFKRIHQIFPTDVKERSAALSTLHLTAVQLQVEMKRATTKAAGLQCQLRKELIESLRIGVSSTAAVINPLQAQLAKAFDTNHLERRFDFATQTEVLTQFEAVSKPPMGPRPPEPPPRKVEAPRRQRSVRF